MAVIDMHDGTFRLEHLSDDRCNERPVHPVKGRRERDHIERPEISGQLLGPKLDPPSVAHAPLGRKPLRLLNHPGVGVEADNLLEHAGEPKRDRSRSATDVKKPASTIKPE